MFTPVNIKPIFEVDKYPYSFFTLIIIDHSASTVEVGYRSRRRPDELHQPVSLNQLINRSNDSFPQLMSHLLDIGPEICDCNSRYAVQIPATFLSHLEVRASTTNNHQIPQSCEFHSKTFLQRHNCNTANSFPNSAVHAFKSSPNSLAHRILNRRLGP